MPHILNLLRQSPFEPLYKHRLQVLECVKLVRPLFEAVFARDLEKQSQIQAEINEFEHLADRDKVEIRRIIPKGIFLPVYREDLLRYLKIQDNLADTVKDISVLLSFKQLSAPPELAKSILEYIDIILGVCHLTDDATDLLRPLVEAGFKGNDVPIVLDLVEKAEVAERTADLAGHALARQLFTMEDKLSAGELLLWFRIFDLLGRMANHAENTGEWLRNMLSH